MAGNSDGSVIIDTELDNSNFDKGSDKLLDKIADLTNAVDNLGDNMMQSFQTVIPILQSISSAATQTNQAISSSAAQTATAEQNIADTAGKAADAIDKQQKAASMAGDVGDDLSDTASAMDSQSTAADSASSSFNGMRKEVVDLNKESQSFAGIMDKISASVKNGFSSGASVLSFKNQLDKADAKALEFEQHLKDFGNTKLPTEDYQWYTQALEKAEKSLNNLIERQIKMGDLGVKENSQQWKSLEYSIAQTKAQINDFKATMSSMRNDGTAFTQGSDTDEYKQMSVQLENARSVLEQNKALINAESIAQAQLNLQVAQEAVAAAKTGAQRERALNNLRITQASLNNLASQPSTKASEPAPAAMSGWKKFGNIMAGVTKTALRAAAAVGKVGFKALAVGAKASYTAIRALGKGLKSFIGFLGKAVSKMKLFNKQSRSMGRNGGVLSSLFSNFKMMVGFSLISKAISAITKEVSESIGMLARFDAEFDKSLSNLINGVKALAGNITVTLSNAIIAIEPILTKIIDAVSQAFTYLNALFAKLQGKSTVTVAKKQTDSYAESLDSAAESAEELKNQVYGFDELNKRSGQNESSQEDEKQPGDLFDEVPVDGLIPEDLLEIFDKIKDAIENGDWYGLGQMAAEGLNNLLKTIDDWINNVLRPKGVEWAKNIAEFLNGFVDAFDWTLLGKTIADGLNAVADIINTFLTTFNFENLGSGIGEAINGFFNNVEWDLIGQTFANSFNALIDLIFGIVNTVDWSLIGDSFADFFNNFFFTVDWNKGSQAITTGLNGIVEAFQHFLDGVDWDAVGSTIGSAIDALINGTDWESVGEVIGTSLNALVSTITNTITSIDWSNLGASVANGFNSLFSTVDWAGIAEGFNAAISALFDSVNTFLAELDWSQLGAHLSNFINNLDVEGWLEDFGTLVSNVITSALDLLIGFVAGIDWGALTDALWNGLLGMIQNVDWNSIVSGAFELLGAAIGAAVSIVATLALDIWDLLKSAWESVKTYFTEYIDDFGGDIVAGLWEGIKNAFVNVGQWIVDNIFNPFIEGFKSAFGIHSPSTVMSEMGGFIVEGLLQGLTDTWESITSFFTETLSALKESLVEKWTDIKDSVSETFAKLKDGISDTTSTIKNKITETWENIKTATLSKWEEIRKTATEKFNNAKERLSETGNNIKSAVTRTWDNIKSDTQQKWNNITTTLGSSLNKMKTTASQRFNELKTDVSSKWNSLKTTLSQTDWSSIGSNLVSGLKNGISNAWSSLTSTVSSLARSVTNTLSGIFGVHSPSKVWAEIGEFLDAGLVKGIKSGAGAILGTTAKLAKTVNSSLEFDTPEIDSTNGSVMNSIDILSNTFDDFIGSLKAITDVFTSAETVPVPAVAAGMTVPYKVRANTYTASDALPELSHGVQEAMSNQTEIMSEVMYLLGQILKVVKEFNLTIDADSLSRIISYARRTQERDFGGV